MDRTQMILLGICAFLVASDLWNAFTPPPPKPRPHHHHHDHHRQDSIPVPKQVLQSAAIPALETVDEPGAGTTVHISFCSSCSYRGSYFSKIGVYGTTSLVQYFETKRFGVIATTWLLGNALQSFLQNTGAFEVECNGELVFSKLRENRFPSELELRQLIARSLGTKHSLPHSEHVI